MAAGKIFARVGILAVVAFALLYPGYRKMKAFNEQVRVLELEIETLESRNRWLNEQIKEVRDDAFFIEKRAREMGLIREGEKIYRVRFTEEEDEDK